MRQYCSLADSKYLPRLLALNDSLVRHSSEPFVLYVLPMDQGADLTLKLLNLPDVLLVDYALFEAEMQLAEAKATRTWAEFCWTCASNLCEYLMRCEVPEITYLDADLFFFADPAPVFKEIGERCIAITPHRLIPSKKHLEVNGKFNVGLVHFKDAYFGRECLFHWAADCRRRCSAKAGCGDQKYLDAWPGTYGEDCHIIENIGVNAGPWSLANWNVTEGPLLDGVPLVAYHFHEMRWNDDGTVMLTHYELRPEDRSSIYWPYIAAVEQATTRIAESLHLQTY